VGLAYPWRHRLGVDASHDALRGRVLKTVDFTGGDGLDRYGMEARRRNHCGRTRFHGATSDFRASRRVHISSICASWAVTEADWRATLSRRLTGHRTSGCLPDRHHQSLVGRAGAAPYSDDPLCEAVERAVRAEIVVVTALEFRQDRGWIAIVGGITSPGNSPFLRWRAGRTRDAERSDDTVASYSSRGRRCSTMC